MEKAMSDAQLYQELTKLSDAALYAELEKFCGGKGSKRPGPCPKGAHNLHIKHVAEANSAEHLLNLAKVSHLRRPTRATAGRLAAAQQRFQQAKAQAEASLAHAQSQGWTHEYGVQFHPVTGRQIGTGQTPARRNRRIQTPAAPAASAADPAAVPAPTISSPAPAERTPVPVPVPPPAPTPAPTGARLVPRPPGGFVPVGGHGSGIDVLHRVHNPANGGRASVVRAGGRLRVSVPNGAGGYAYLSNEFGNEQEAIAHAKQHANNQNVPAPDPQGTARATSPARQQPAQQSNRGPEIMNQWRRNPNADNEPVNLFDGSQVQTLRHNGANESIRNVIGKDLDDAGIARLVGAPPGTKLTVTPNVDGFVVQGSKSGFFQYQRTFRKRGDSFYCHNDVFFLHEDAEEGGPNFQQGLGTQVLSTQVEEMIKHGAIHLETNGGRSPKHQARNPTYRWWPDGTPRMIDGMNGYYTWPRLGYNCKISELRPYTQQALRSAGFGNAATLRDVLTTEAGRDWWKENGESMVLYKIDLSPNSPDVRALRRYGRRTT